MHPYIPELKALYRRGRVSRREFVSMGSLLGLSMASMAAFVTACAQQAPAPPTAISVPSAPTRPPAAPPTLAPTAAPQPTVAAAAPQPTRPAAAAPTAAPQPSPTAGIKRGGTLSVGGRVQRLDNLWVVASAQHHMTRQVTEYLTLTDAKNVTHPYLLQKWEPSEDLKTWTMTLRKGIAFNKSAGFSGRELDADDAIFTLKGLLDEKTGSSARGLMQGYLDASGIEKIDKYTFKLHLKRAEVGLPEHLFHYTNGVVPKEWGGDWVKQPWGTGPYTMEEHVTGERVRLKRREGYWQNGADGKPFPYIDEINWVDYGEETATLVASMAAGQIDYTESGTISLVPAMQMLRGFTVYRSQTGETAVFRMRADQSPWDDVRVRNALKWCQDRQRSLNAAFMGLGTLATDTHVSPIHPEWSPMEPWKQDIGKAKALLTEAGYANGLTVTLTYSSGTPEAAPMAQVLQQEATKAGIKIELSPVPSASYSSKWTEWNFGLTGWVHRPLASMVHALAYTCGASWNESHWCDKEYDALLNQASATYDLEKRRLIFGKLMQRIQENGAIAIPFWKDTFRAASSKLKGVTPHPTRYPFLWEAWWDR